MAALYIDSFDYYTTAELLQNHWTEFGGFGSANNPVVNTDAGARSGYGVQLSNASDTIGSKSLRKTLSSVTSTTAMVGVRFKTSTLSNLGGNLVGGQEAHAILALVKAGTYQIRAQVQADGTIAIYRGGDQQYTSATLLGTSSLALVANTQYYIWLKVLFHASAGTIQLKVNGVNWLPLSGINTINSGSSPYWNQVFLGPIHVSSGNHTFSYDDVVIQDGSGSYNNTITCNSPIVEARFPLSAGAHTTWTPLADTNREEVDDAIGPDGSGNDGDTTYNSTTGVNNIDTFIFQPTSFTGVNVLAVQRNIVGRNPAGGASTLRGVYRHSATDYTGADLGLSTGYTSATDILDSNPATSAVWTTDDIATPNEHGYKKTA